MLLHVFVCVVSSSRAMSSCCLHVYEQLTDDVHLAEVQADFGEGGDAGGSVVSPTVTVLSSGAIGWTLGGVVEPEKHTHTLAQLYTWVEFLHLQKTTLPGVTWLFVMKQAVLIVILLAVYLKPKISEKFSPSPVVKVMYSCGVSVCIPAQ